MTRSRERARPAGRTSRERALGARLGTKAVALLTLAVVLAAQVRPAAAFKVKTHVYTANIAMADVVDGSAYFPGLVRPHRIDPSQYQQFDQSYSLGSLWSTTSPEIPIRNDELRRAIIQYPEFVRGGAVGPDGFPDLFWGQLATHPNMGAFTASDYGLKALSPKYAGTAIGSGASMPLRDENDPYTWRTIDWGMHLLKKVDAYHAGAQPGTQAYAERLQAIAFVYGYLMHISGDANVHGVINEQVKQVFSIWSGQGMFGPVSEELMHMAMEGLIDDHFTAAVFTDARYTRDPNTLDPKLPGDNGVVTTLPFQPGTLTCPPTPAPRWKYCNEAKNGVAGLGGCQTAEEKPAVWGACDPWTQICAPPGEAAARINGLVSRWSDCGQSCNGDGSAACRLRWLEPALTPLPETCDPTKIYTRDDPENHVTEMSNECILINCAYYPDACPSPGIMGFEDRRARPVPCHDSADQFTGAALAAFLAGTDLAAPQDFLYSTFIEDPADQTVAQRNLGGPHLKALLVSRDWMRTAAHNPLIASLTLNPARAIKALSEEIAHHGIAGEILGDLGIALASFLDWALDLGDTLVCIGTFGLFCPDHDAPIFSPSLLLEKRAALVDEQLHRYMDLSTCVVQNLVRGAEWQTAVRGPMPDACMDRPWYAARVKEEVDAHPFGVYDMGPSLFDWCVYGGPDPAPETGDPGTDMRQMGPNVKKVFTFLVHDTIRKVLTLQESDFGVKGPLAEGLWVVTEALLVDVIGAPIKAAFNEAAGRICHITLESFAPQYAELAAAIDHIQDFPAGESDANVNVAFLLPDVTRDPVYRARVFGLLDNGERALLSSMMTSPPQYIWDTRIRAADTISAKIRAATRPCRGPSALEGPKLREMRAYLHLVVPSCADYDSGTARTDDVKVIRVPALYNTIQMNKLATFGREGISSLEAAGNAIPSWQLPPGAFERNAPANLTAGAVTQTDGGQGEFDTYDPWCKYVHFNLLCNSTMKPLLRQTFLRARRLLFCRRCGRRRCSAAARSCFGHETAP